MSASTDSHAFRPVGSAGAANASLSPADRFALQAQDAVLLVARILMAYIFIKSGFGKLTDMGGFTNVLASRGVPAPQVFGVIGPCVEFFGGLTILLGFKIRYTAPLMAVFTIVATAISHRYWEFTGPARVAQSVNFEKNVCIIGGFLVLFIAGAGRYSIDGMLRRR